jgi:hypothetical protein
VADTANSAAAVDGQQPLLLTSLSNRRVEGQQRVAK